MSQAIQYIKPDAASLKNRIFKNVSGYMPKAYQFGFIYNQYDNIRTIAHELSHGAFHLKHTFAAGDDYIAPEETTDNLMDYAGGETLNHWQWQDIHLPKSVRFKWLQDEAGAEGIIDTSRVRLLWACLPYAERTSKSKYEMLKRYYDFQYNISSSHGEIQVGEAADGHNYSKSDILQKFELKSELTKYKIERLESLDENETRIMFENGRTPLLSLYPGIDCIGLKSVLSPNVYDRVIDAFYNKKLDRHYFLEFDTSSSLSNDLHINYNFQKDYYIGKVMKYLYENISNIQLMEKIAGVVKCPNFSNKSDILTYDFYGLMGGTQKVDYEIEVYKRYDKGLKTTFYLIQLDLSIHDWFGSDIEDIDGKLSGIKNNMACLAAFFWLQHHYNYTPFETVIRFRDYIIIKQ